MGQYSEGDLPCLNPNIENIMTLIGTDIEQISRMQQVMARTPQFVQRVFTTAEQEYCNRKGRPAQHYAARFCAKEAVAKALGFPVRWHEIEVVKNAQGAPGVRTQGETATQLGRRTIKLSLAHSGDYAVATALIE